MFCNWSINFNCALCPFYLPLYKPSVHVYLTVEVISERMSVQDPTGESSQSPTFQEGDDTGNDTGPIIRLSDMLWESN